ncbi:hypothetical protein PanWU01x14_360200 [Parasponia andersonii]|uniref:Transmembrane protein n=1 Tax=Parasponia andersonii TaxID=3476 RepID=A0A2P5A7R8_PARAD|nr:hypothetical protein PanWU01x14_360200 [Parasponia andersonii]
MISIFEISIAPSTSAPGTLAFLTTPMMILTCLTLKLTQNRSTRFLTVMYIAFRLKETKMVSKKPL